MSTRDVTPIRQHQHFRRAPSETQQFRDQIVGKTIAAVVAKPGRDGEPPSVLMMQFDDGTVVEWVSPRSDVVLRRALNQSSRGSVVSCRLVEPQQVLPLPAMDMGEGHRFRQESVGH